MVAHGVEFWEISNHAGFRVGTSGRDTLAFPRGAQFWRASRGPGLTGAGSPEDLGKKQEGIWQETKDGESEICGVETRSSRKKPPPSSPRSARARKQFPGKTLGLRRDGREALDRLPIGYARGQDSVSLMCGLWL